MRTVLLIAALVLAASSAYLVAVSRRGRARNRVAALQSASIGAKWFS
jgi:hypothetical protein